MELRFGSDVQEREFYQVPESFSHPAKMSVPLLKWITESFTSEGETVLDPMCGIFTTAIAATMGRSVIGVELEERFCEIAWKNAGKLKTIGPELGYRLGEMRMIQGDARRLPELLAGCGPVGCVLSSPPYSGGSEPFASQKYLRIRREIGRDTSKPSQQAEGYGGNPSNIGNSRDGTYFSEMLKVYQSCHCVLKLGGLAILVVKPFVRNKELVPLQEDTRRLMEKAGFAFQEEHHRILTQESFWRRIYRRRHPEAPAVDREYVLVFRKC